MQTMHLFILLSFCVRPYHLYHAAVFWHRYSPLLWNTGWEMSHTCPTFLAASPFKFTRRLLAEEEKRCRYIQPASGIGTASTLADNWDGPSVMRGLHYGCILGRADLCETAHIKSTALISGPLIGVVMTASCCLALFFSVASFSTIIINIWFFFLQVLIYIHASSYICTPPPLCLFSYIYCIQIVF